jgi:endoglucanase
MNNFRILCVGFLAVATWALSLHAETAADQTPSKLPPGMFSTLGSQVVDAHRTPVRLACVYWPGRNHKDNMLANVNKPFLGVQANVDAIAATGFNCIRVDINNISLNDSAAPVYLAELDDVVAAAKKDDIRIIIDDHDNEGNYGTNVNNTADCAAQQSNGMWYDLGGAADGTDGCKDPGHTTQASFQKDWVAIATRYAHNNTVIG